MIHDSMLASRGSLSAGNDRRYADRIPFPCDIVLQWHHDFATPVRYRVIDVSDGGMRIASNLPLVEGMTGMAMRILPEGRAIDRSVMVAWCKSGRKGEADEPCEVGLCFF